MKLSTIVILIVVAIALKATYDSGLPEPVNDFFSSVWGDFRFLCNRTLAAIVRLCEQYANDLDKFGRAVCKDWKWGEAPRPSCRLEHQVAVLGANLLRSVGTFLARETMRANGVDPDSELGRFGAAFAKVDPDGLAGLGEIGRTFKKMFA